MEKELQSEKVSYILNFKKDTKLIREILELSAPSYKSNMQLVEREVNHNRDIYIIKGLTGELLAFFMVNPEELNGQNSYYLGLSACHDNYKGKGLVKSLYMAFMKDCKFQELIQKKSIILWWTTATPIVYYWFNKYIKDVQPDMDGLYNQFGKSMAEIIVREKFDTTDVDQNHPFILRNVAVETNYSEQEVERLNSAACKLNTNVFEKYNVNEKNGDRFLMIGYTPDHLVYYAEIA